EGLRKLVSAIGGLPGLLGEFDATQEHPILNTVINNLGQIKALGDPIAMYQAARNQSYDGSAFMQLFLTRSLGYGLKMLAKPNSILSRSFKSIRTNRRVKRDTEDHLEQSLNPRGVLNQGAGGNGSQNATGRGLLSFIGDPLAALGQQLVDSTQGMVTSVGNAASGFLGISGGDEG
ncbi:unnamed protein product, partial [Allacma fusca]